ncbi:MAG TPA: glycosyltransferase family 9 protein, partial [Arthrobacter sp.]|nr:glycosyltransferase family 9 protein [Arthrobacter sp.]
MSRVLVARLDSAGDVLLAGPAVRAVAAGRDGRPNEVLML